MLSKKEIRPRRCDNSRERLNDFLHEPDKIVSSSDFRAVIVCCARLTADRQEEGGRFVAAPGRAGLSLSYRLTGTDHHVSGFVLNEEHGIIDFLCLLFIQVLEHAAEESGGDAVDIGGGRAAVIVVLVYPGLSMLYVLYYSSTVLVCAIYVITVNRRCLHHIG